MPTETEIKLLVPPGRAAAIDAALMRLPGARRTLLDAHYVDTRDRRLARHGIALRLRRDDGAWEQTLKTAGASALERGEHSVARPGRWGAGGLPPIEPALHRDTAAGERLRAALADGDAAGAALVTAYRVHVRRLVATVAFEAAVVEIAFDRGRIGAAGRSEGVCELEYELKSGDPQALVALARAAVQVHGACLSVVSKAERGDRLARAAAAPDHAAHRDERPDALDAPDDGGRPALAHRAAAPMLDRAMDARTLRRAMVGACLQQVLANASEVAAGTWNDETVHQWRIGLRRLRTAVRELSPSGALDPPWLAPMQDAFHALGAYRDARLVPLAVEARLETAGLPSPARATLEAAARLAGPEPDALVRDPALQCAMLDAIGGELLSCAPPASGAPLRRRIARRLARLHARLVRDARDFGTMRANAQHAMRRRAKRLRYLGELAGGLYPRRRVARYLKTLGAAQDVLGERVDLRVAIAALRIVAEAGADPAASGGALRLASLLPANETSCRRALRRVARARPFW